MSVNRKILLVAAFAFALGAAAAGLALWRPGSGPAAPSTASAEKATGVQYHCPMHPSYVSDRPGECPICQMRLIPSEDETHTAPPATAAAPKKRTIYRSTMNPSEVSDSPGKDSMGMEMAPVEIEEPPAGSGSKVEGRVPVRISIEKQQLIGVKTFAVERRPVVRTIRTVGRVTWDETRLHHVHTKIGGWIERLYADSTGALVKKGEPLLTIYSPELLSSQQEYLLALRARDRLAGSASPSLSQTGEDLAASARRRLRLFDLSDAQIDALDRSGEVTRTTTLYAPITGHVIVRNVTQGEKIDSGMTLLDIADLSRIWVQADIYEYELPFIAPGQRGTLTLSYLPGRSFAGRVTFINPFLSETTRTVKVRLEYDNPGLALKPGMFGQVELESDLGVRLVVPDSAVISTGERDIVFVDRGEGYFEPRELKLGVRLPDSVEVLEGLSEGERVLTSGNFLIDSESKLKSALSAAGAPKPAAGPATPAEVGDHRP
jgi:Cu(I)/Ag(I) efflux system membrane fusion protein/cobalt-zinc-cadmium efflux system membrane fusion protein